MRKLELVVLILLSVASTACSTLAARLLNKRFPPVSVTDKRLQAVVETEASLEKVTSPDLYAFVRPELVQEGIKHALTDEPLEDEAGQYQVRLIEPWITMDHADIRLSTDFEAVWRDATTKRHRVTLVGRLAVHAVPTIVTTADGGFAVGTRVAAENVHFSSLFAEKELGWWWWFLKRDEALGLATPLVNWAVTRINGQIEDQSTPLKLAPIELLSKNPKPPKGSPIVIIPGDPVALRMELAPAAIAVDSSGLYAIAEVSPYSGAPPHAVPLPPVVVPPISEREKERLIEQKNSALREGILKAANSFAAPLPRETSFAIRKQAVAEVINQSLSVVNRCAEVHYQGPETKRDFEIPMPKIELHCADLDKIDCSTDERCFTYFRRLAENNQNMNCDHEEEYTWEDFKDAAACLAAPNPLNPACEKVLKKGVHTVTDLVCEGLKTVAQGWINGQKTIEDFAAQVGQKDLLDNVCRADNFKDKVFCEGAKATIALGCQGVQTALDTAWKAGQKIGDTGLIAWKVADGDAGIRFDADGNACVSNLSVAPDLSRFSITGSLGGHADIKDSWLHFKPTAYGTAIVGCVETQIDAKDFSVTLVDAPGSFQGAITLDECTDPTDGAAIPCLRLSVAEQELKLKVDPEPVETIISQNWDSLGLACAWQPATGVPPIPFALTAAWVLNHYQDVGQIVGGDRQFFYVKQKFAPSIEPLLLHQTFTRWDEKEQRVVIDWRPGVIVGYAK